MKMFDRVRVRPGHTGPWHMLAGKIGQILIPQAVSGLGVWGVTFQPDQLWHVPLPGESRVFYLEESDLEVMP